MTTIQPRPGMPPQPQSQPQPQQQMQPGAGNGADPVDPEGQDGGGAPAGGQNREQLVAQLFQPDQQIAAVLWMRVDHLQPQEVAALDQVITPQSAPVLMKVFPELIPLIEKSTALGGAGGQPNPAGAPPGGPTPPATPGPSQQMPPAAPPQMGLAQQRMG